MFRSLLCSVSLALVLLSGSVYAETAPGQSNFRFSIGPQLYHHEYTEPGLMKQDGFFSGVAYNITYEKGIMLSLDGVLAYGQVDYSSTSTGSMDDKDNYCSDIRFLVGYTTYKSGKVKMTPYAGIAYRYLFDEGQNRYTTTGHFAYDRESNYIYSPLGFKFDIAMGNGWSFLPLAEFDIFWAGTQKSDLGYQAGYEDFETDQDSGHGFRASLGFIKQIKRFAFGFELFYRYWDIDRSDVYRDSWGRNWVEPANDTTEIGVGATFRF